MTLSLRPGIQKQKLKPLTRQNTLAFDDCNHSCQDHKRNGKKFHDREDFLYNTGEFNTNAVDEG